MPQKLQACIGALVGLALSTLIINPARAVTIFDDFGAGYSYNTGSGNALGFGSVAVKFTSGGDYTLTQLDLALAGPSGVKVSLLADGVADTPGSLIDFWTISSSSMATFPPGSVHTIPVISDIQLLTGVTYWLQVGVTPDSQNDATWMANNQGATGRECLPAVCFNNQNLPAFDVIGISADPVPLPPSFALFATGLIGLGWFARRRKKQPA